MDRRICIFIILATFIAMAGDPVVVAAADSSADSVGQPSAPSNKSVQIQRIAPQGKSGQGYRLVYWVNVPPDVFWSFKTDFDNRFLVDNKFIREHRFVSRKEDIVITENKYSYGPDVYFRWQTIVSPSLRRLDFRLLNPEECHQNYHYGTIQVTPLAGGTRITQVAYFDFWGASFWAYYPWKGGMRDFLSYTAQWERQTMLRLEDRYRNHTGQRRQIEDEPDED